MKKNYENPEIEVLAIAVDDVITTSGGPDEGDGGTEIIP